MKYNDKVRIKEWFYEWLVWTLQIIMVVVFVLGSFLHLFVWILNMDWCKWIIWYTGVQQEDCIKK